MHPRLRSSSAVGPRRQRLWAPALSTLLALCLAGCASVPDDDAPGGYEDSPLYTYGRWGPVGPWGQVWYPYDAPPGWTPYRQGYWSGGVWIDAAPWGRATARPGRWVQLDGRWGWVPSAPIVVRPPPRPVPPLAPGYPTWRDRDREGDRGRSSPPPAFQHPPQTRPAPPDARPPERVAPPTAPRNDAVEPPRAHIPRPVLRDAPPAATPAPMPAPEQRARPPATPAATTPPTRGERRPESRSEGRDGPRFPRAAQ